MKPGESRIVRELPCPPRQMARPNEYWLLRRAGNRLMEHFNYWDLTAWRNYQDAMVILKTLADGMPTHPSKGWTKFQMGIVREICCPTCEKLFEWEGNFYEPQCPHCERILRTRLDVI
jgi:hypothetical protein